MIGRGPFVKIGVGHRGYRLGAEPDPCKPDFIRKPDPQQDIDRCLNCTMAYCSGECKFTPGGTAKRNYKTKQREERLRLAQVLEQKGLARAEKVSKLYLDGWCESGIARELGLTVQEVNDSIKLARKRGLLY